MVQFESGIKQIPFSQERVYNKLSDLNNLNSLHGHLDEIKEKTGGKLEEMTFDRDSLTVKVQNIGLTLRMPVTRKRLERMRICRIRICWMRNEKGQMES